MLRRYYGKISFLPIESFVGKDGELVIDDVTNRVYVMDGNTPGGNEITSVNGNVSLGNLSVAGQTISGTEVNGNIHIDPNGTGNLVVGGNIYMGIGDFKVRRRIFNNEPTVIISSDTSSVTIRSANTFNYMHFDRVTGNIGINTELPAYRFDVVGDARVTNTFTADKMYSNMFISAGSGPVDKQGYRFGSATNSLGEIEYDLTQGMLRLINRGNVGIEITEEGRVNFPVGIQGNINPLFSNAYALGNVTHQWKELWVGNNTIYIGGTPVGVSNGALVVNGTPINLNGVVVSNSAPTLIPGAQWFNSEEGRLYVNYSNTWVEASPTQIDPSALRADTNGNIELPSGLTFTPLSNFAPAYGTVIQQNPGEIINLFTTAEGGGTSLGWVENPSAAGNIAAISFNQWPRTVSIDTGNFNDTVYSWRFDQFGGLNLPAGGIISEGTSPTTVGNTITLTPNGGLPSQALLIYPTAGGDGDHIHLTAGGGTTELYLGNDNHYVKLVNDGNIEIRTDDLSGNVGTWNFAANGNLTLPVGGNISYSPANSNDWNGSPPTTIEQAIDRLAALVKTLNSGTGA